MISIDDASRFAGHVPGSLVNVRRRRSVDQKAQQFGAAVVAACIQKIDLRKIKIGDDAAVTRCERLADQSLSLIHI